ncbi:hypothetical protein ASPWEDRAFT_149298 [Aspergillus wentii DTO 134E9]|uniref:Uncharacterized protein n=1 Tax=Aspergillus wentii DTO 134E9 TaxID=1073089 RepID=A0A1L9RV96_ASPWE|nr:uncharacterized protein ASPWEDRAFT_149298 [Aspergillus wentii DTO 134E9]KAI9928689.1 hypothetical protein MW887_001906 [Aspergillus wentii]OJJ38777.1 hypothetical protein ASPWEDRAFT_149298 [Aspergillus wentii DTO 134E9]
MRLSIYTILSLTLPLAVTANPLVKRKETECTIVSHGDGWVNCRRQPRVNGEYWGKVQNGVKSDYLCYAIGDCYEGNCTWDWNFDMGCYINGYYTSSKCSTDNLPKCKGEIPQLS